MEVLILTVFVSVVLVAGGVLFFAWNVRQRAHEHIDQLSLLPLEEDSQPTPKPAQGKGLA
jgi:nitrogen fixation-related uncharacterized protein